MAALLKVTGEEYPVVPALGAFSIEQLQELVNSPFITVVPVKWERGTPMFIVADEEGFNSKPFNVKASREASRPLYGDVVLAKFEELGGAKEIS